VRVKVRVKVNFCWNLPVFRVMYYVLGLRMGRAG
jgi:hypothetical protein